MLNYNKIITLIVMTLTLGIVQTVHAMKHSKQERTLTVSYLYYPYWEGCGHAELEVDGQCYTLKSGGAKIKSLHDRILKREEGDGGLPFYRYVITVTPEEFNELKKIVGQRDFYTFICSLEALNDLSHAANFSVPLPFRLSPLISSRYLSLMKKLGSERIQDIEFYDNKETHDLMSEGVWIESFVIGGTLFCAYMVIMIIKVLI